MRANSCAYPCHLGIMLTKRVELYAAVDKAGAEK